MHIDDGYYEPHEPFHGERRRTSVHGFDALLAGQSQMHQDMTAGFNQVHKRIDEVDSKVDGLITAKALDDQFHQGQSDTLKILEEAYNNRHKVFGFVAGGSGVLGAAAGWIMTNWEKIRLFGGSEKP